MRFALLFVLFLGVTGCNRVRQGAEQSRNENALKALSIDYLEYQNARSTPPTSAAELAAGIPKPMLQPGEVDSLTVQWGVKFGPGVEGGDQRVFAVGKPVGGKVAVLMQNGTVKQIPESELASLPRAEPPKKP